MRLSVPLLLSLITLSFSLLPTAAAQGNSNADAAYIRAQRETADTANARLGVIQGLSRIPRVLKYSVLQDGCRVVITPTIIEYKRDLASTKPRGYTHGGGYDNCPALYLPAENEIVVSERWGYRNAPAQAGTVNSYEESLGHEFGHAFDSFLGKWAQGGVRRQYYNITQTKWFKDSFTSEMKRLTNEQRRESSYFTQGGSAGPSELFAELFASLFSASPTARQRTLAQAFPQTCAKIRQLASLSNYSRDTIYATAPGLVEGSAPEDN